MVPGSGLEPLHLTAQASETCVSTNSTTRAIICSTIFYGNVAGSLFDFLTPRFPTICIKPAKNEKRGWERTNVTNLLRNRQRGLTTPVSKSTASRNGGAIGTTVFSVAKLRLADLEKAARAQGIAARAESEAGDGNESNAGRFAAIDCQRAEPNASLSTGTKLRRKIAVTAVLRTWPDFPKRDVPHLTPPNGQAWDAKALREGRASSHPRQRPIQPPACWGRGATGRFTVR